LYQFYPGPSALISIKGRCFAFGARKLLGFDLPSGIHGQNAFLGQPGKERPDRGRVLHFSCRRARVLLDVCRNRDRLDTFQASQAGALAPIQKLAGQNMADRAQTAREQMRGTGSPLPKEAKCAGSGLGGFYLLATTDGLTMVQHEPAFERIQ
jgi:hypothetical protein